VTRAPRGRCDFNKVVGALIWRVFVIYGPSVFIINSTDGLHERPRVACKKSCGISGALYSCVVNKFLWRSCLRTCHARHAKHNGKLHQGA
jgi:hypothetical protein